MNKVFIVERHHRDEGNDILWVFEDKAAFVKFLQTSLIVNDIYHIKDVLEKGQWIGDRFISNRDPRCHVSAEYHDVL